MRESRFFGGVASGQRMPRSGLADTRFASSPYLSSDERHALEQAATTTQSIGAGTDMLREGERSDLLHIVVEGWACRYKTTRDGARQIVTVLVPGDVANLDSALLDRLDYAVRTLTPAKILTISRERMMALAGQYAGVAKTLAWLAMVENAVLSQGALRLGRQSAKQQIAHFLCELGVRLRSAEREGASSYGLPLTQEQIADVLGLTAVHVNRTLQQLRGEGLIETGGRTIRIADVKALRRVGEFDPAYLHERSAASDGEERRRINGDIARAAAAAPAP